MGTIDGIMSAINGVLWHDVVLWLLLGTGVTFTFWSGFCQYRALTHGSHVLRGRYDDPDDPGAINHFQALSAALSATVGLGNIGGVALAIALGGPGAIFWMWVVGFFGMAIKLTEVTLSMLYRNTDDPDNPHGGPMWVISKGAALMNPRLAGLGKTVGAVFCITLLVSTATGGNMFQAWNVAEITHAYFGIPGIVTGIVLAVLVAMVIIGGIKRIGAVAGRLVPVMVALYLLAGSYVLLIHAERLPGLLKLIVTSAFSATEGTGAFLGGTVATAFLFGMKRALFSNEAGQGSSPIAHSAAKTNEPVREGIVAGLEPFIDTLVVCTFTALVILSSGVWNRLGDAVFDAAPRVVSDGPGGWTLQSTPPPGPIEWVDGEAVFMILIGDSNPTSGNNRHKLFGHIAASSDGVPRIQWESMGSAVEPVLAGPELYRDYQGATLTARAFDTVQDGLGKWLVTLAAWLFAISTMISWSYYGEQGMVYLAGERSVLAYKLIYCLLILIATAGFIRTDVQLDNLTGIGTGVMLFANVPIMWIFGAQAMRAYKDYVGRLDAGLVGPGHAPPSLEDLISGRDVESQK
ncbi:MAG: sodium:alanine symporter family protein [Gammaproteobacteria bacterium]|nr:MAG: sodium:alanine symporter family protein [Gammaproteobacteria bacterium]